MILGGLLMFASLAIILANLQKIIDMHYCMTDCCDPTSPDAETNGMCWDCRGTGHAHAFIKDNGRVS